MKRDPKSILRILEVKKQIFRRNQRRLAQLTSQISHIDQEKCAALETLSKADMGLMPLILPMISKKLRHISERKMALEAQEEKDRQELRHHALAEKVTENIYHRHKALMDAAFENETLEDICEQQAQASRKVTMLSKKGGSEH